MAHFNTLFTPIEIAGLELRNRLVMSPMTTNYATSDGMVTDRLCSYYEARAQGGAGLIIVEGAVVHPTGKGLAFQVGIWSDAHVAGLERLVKGIKAKGARAVLQLIHCGRQAPSITAGSQPVAPSPIACPRIGEVPKELSVDEIGEIEHAFALAADRARRAGFDGVELHGGTGYLLTEFLSPQANRRTDAYGGSLDNRARMIFETIDLVKKTVGKEYPILYRLCADEFLDGGTTLEESRITAGMLERAGIVLLDVVGGTYASTRSPAGPTGTPKAFYLDLADSIKHVVSVPVMTVGAIYEPVLAEEILQSGKADLIGIGRGLLADPDLPQKAVNGRADEITPCVRCLACTARTMGPGSACLVNPSTGHEDELRPQPIQRPKRVLVIGSGIAALEAARRAASRGHRVSIMEDRSSPGGLLALRARVPGQEEFAGVVRHFVQQVEKLGVPMLLGKKVTPESVAGFDIVVVASAGSPLIASNIAGLGDGIALQARDVLDDPTLLGNTTGTVAVLGTGLFGGETALFLADRGKKVVLIDSAADVAATVAPATRGMLLAGLKARGVDIRTSSTVQNYSQGTLRMLRGQSEEEIASIEKLVLALGFSGPQSIADSLEGLVTEVRCVAEIYDPMPATEAVYEAAKIGNSI